MRRITLVIVATALALTSGIGAALLWKYTTQQRPPDDARGPLRISILPETRRPWPDDHHLMMDIRVTNVSGKTVRGYALMFTGPSGSGKSIPVPERQMLHPGESQVQTIGCMGEPTDVRADFVNFADRSTWGPNLSRSEGYVRE